MFEKDFEKLISLLSRGGDSIEPSREGIGMVAEDLRLGRVLTKVEHPTRLSSERREKTTEIELFTKDAPVEETGRDALFEFDRGASIRVEAFPLKGVTWSPEEERCVDTLINLLFMHVSRHLLVEAFHRQMTTYFLTGLPNIEGFMRHAQRLGREGTLRGFDAYYYNIRGFALVNQRFGKKEGDEVLRRYARIFSSFATAKDECIGHLGGDNFVALIRKERHEEFLRLLSGASVFAVRADGRRVSLKLPAVAGVLPIESDDIEPGQIISRVSVAFNIAKHHAHVPCFVATEEMNERILRERKIVAIFSRSLADGEFVVYYQPKVDTKTLMLVGAEALVRWYHKGSVVSPADFVPVLENNGDITELDMFVLSRVCQDIQGWQCDGIDVVPISVNFSRKDISEPRLPDRILSTIQQHGVDKEYIQAELTETTNAVEQGLLTKFMLRMKTLGISMAIDDFGTGYSSLNILRDFPVDVIKIDKSFLDVSVSAKNDKIVLSNIISMAKQLNMNIVTEGVETVDQMEFLQSMGCNVVQGYLFGRPMPYEEFTEVLKKKYYEAPLSDYREGRAASARMVEK